MLVVVTADQRRSRRGDDRVPAVLRELNGVRRRGTHRDFERTAGDEVQGVLGSAEEVVATLEQLARDGAWSVGVGVGDAEQPLPASTRAGRGPAFVHARHAVEAAKNNRPRVAVVTDDAIAGERLETVLMLWYDLLGRRSAAGWEVTDLLAAGLTHAEVAGRLGVSQSAVSQRASAAGARLSVRARTLAVELVADLLAPGGGT